MALDTYSGLQTSAANWLNRQDLTAQVPDFITLGEAHMNRKLRTLQMEFRAFGVSSDDGTVPVPGDWLETRTFRLTGPTAGQQILEYVGEEEWDQLEASGLTGTSRYYTIINGEFQILPAPPTDPVMNYTLRYYGMIPALSDTNTTNWLLAKSPDLYLYSTLLAAEAYLKDDDRLPIWKSIRDEIIQDMTLESERAKRPTTRLRTVRSTYG